MCQKPQLAPSVHSRRLGNKSGPGLAQEAHKIFSAQCRPSIQPRPELLATMPGAIPKEISKFALLLSLASLCQPFFPQYFYDVTVKAIGWYQNDDRGSS